MKNTATMTRGMVGTVLPHFGPAIAALIRSSRAHADTIDVNRSVERDVFATVE